IVVGLVEAARVEEGDQRRLGRRKLVLAREARGWPEALADLGRLGAGQEADNRGLATLRLAEQPEDRHRQLLADLFTGVLHLGLALGGGEQALELGEHGVGTSGRTARREGVILPFAASRPYTSHTPHLFLDAQTVPTTPVPILRTSWA